MFSSSSRALLVFALTLTLGTHWMLLQSVAWLGMVVSYSQQCSLTEAISRAFDGQHPCKLCKLVSKGKAQEKQQETPKLSVQLDKFLPANTPPRFYRAPIERLESPFLPAGRQRQDPPPAPPPRTTFTLS